MRTTMNSTVLISLLACILVMTSPCFALSDDIVSANAAQGNPNPIATPVNTATAADLSAELAAAAADAQTKSAADALTPPATDNTPTTNDKSGAISTIEVPAPANITEWEKLQPLSVDKLTAMLSKSDDPIKSAWLELALISKDRITDQKKMVDALMKWRDENPTHPGNKLFPADNLLSSLEGTVTPMHIAVLLPESGKYASAAKQIHAGLLSAYHNNKSVGDKQAIVFYDTNAGRSISDIYKQAVTDGADFIVGPLTKADVKELNKNAPFDVPVLALNYADSNNVDDNFYQFGLLPEDDATQIAWRAHSANLAHALVIAPNDPWGKRLTTAFASQWAKLGGTIQENWYFTPKTDLNTGIPRALGINLETDERLSKIKNNLAAQMQQRRQDIDVIVLFSQAKEASLIVPLLNFYYAGNLPVYATSAVFTHNTISNRDLNKVIVCDVPQGLRSSSGDTFSHKLYAMGQDAYNLSQSIQRLAVLPNFPVYSATGALVIDDKQQVHRRLPCVSIKSLTSSHTQYASNS